MNFIHPALQVRQTKGRGRGVFTTEDLPEGTVVEVAPVIVMKGSERPLLDQTLLHDYIFLWGKKEDQCCMALGLVPVYNHSYQPNCIYEMNFAKHLMAVITIQDIKAGKELFFNYNGEAGNDAPLWFDVK